MSEMHELGIQVSIFINKDNEMDFMENDRNKEMLIMVEEILKKRIGESQSASKDAGFNRLSSDYLSAEQKEQKRQVKQVLYSLLKDLRTRQRAQNPLARKQTITGKQE